MPMSMYVNICLNERQLGISHPFDVHIGVNLFKVLNLLADPHSISVSFPTSL